MTQNDTETDEADYVALDLKAAVQIADILEMHYEMTTESAYDETAHDADHFAEEIRDRLPELHGRFGHDYYCRMQGASFEPQEIGPANSCPWCGRYVDTDVDHDDSP